MYSHVLTWNSLWTAIWNGSFHRDRSKDTFSISCLITMCFNGQSPCWGGPNSGNSQAPYYYPGGHLPPSPGISELAAAALCCNPSREDVCYSWKGTLECFQYPKHHFPLTWPFVSAVLQKTTACFLPLTLAFGSRIPSRWNLLFLSSHRIFFFHSIITFIHPLTQSLLSAAYVAGTVLVLVTQKNMRQAIFALTEVPFSWWHLQWRSRNFQI